MDDSIIRESSHFIENHGPFAAMSVGIVCLFFYYILQKIKGNGSEQKDEIKILHLRIDKTNEKLDKTDEKIDRMLEDIHFIKGKISGK